MTQKLIYIFNAPFGSVQQGIRNSASDSRNTNQSENERPIRDETKKIPLNGHRIWSSEMGGGMRIKLAVDSNDPVEIFPTDSCSDENWRNGASMYAYDAREQKCRGTGQFTAPRSGEHFLVVSNEGEVNTKVDDLVRVV